MLVTFPVRTVATFREEQDAVMQFFSQRFGPTAVSSVRKWYLEEHRLEY